MYNTESCTICASVLNEVELTFPWHCLQNILESTHSDTLSFQALQEMDAEEGGIHLLMEAAQCRHRIYSMAPLMSH